MRWSSIFVMMVLLNARASTGQAQKAPVRRFNVVGKVLDRNGHPIQWGRVWVKDTHAHLLKIKPISPDGRFGFKWLDSRLDYEIYAEQGAAVSAKVLVSGNRESQEVVINLKSSRNQDEK